MDIEEVTIRNFIDFSRIDSFISFQKSAQCLDYKRLGKQRVEAKQILNALEPDYDKKGWKTHPATMRWKGYEDCLKYYANCMITEWKKRGYNNIMEK